MQHPAGRPEDPRAAPGVRPPEADAEPRRPPPLRRPLRQGAGRQGLGQGQAGAHLQVQSDSDSVAGWLIYNHLQDGRVTS